MPKHSGRHTHAYHDFVLGEMRGINSMSNGNPTVFKSEFTKRVIDVIKQNPEMMYMKK